MDKLFLSIILIIYVGTANHIICAQDSPVMAVSYFEDFDYTH